MPQAKSGSADSDENPDRVSQHGRAQEHPPSARPRGPSEGNFGAHEEHLGSYVVVQGRIGKAPHEGEAVDQSASGFGRRSPVSELGK